MANIVPCINSRPDNGAFSPRLSDNYGDESSHPAAEWNSLPLEANTEGKTASEGGVVVEKENGAKGGSRYKKSSRINSRGCTLVKGDV